MRSGPGNEFHGSRRRPGIERGAPATVLGVAAGLLVGLVAGSPETGLSSGPSSRPSVVIDTMPGVTETSLLFDEPHLRNIRQLTFGGENAEAYFSFDGTRLVFQSTRPPHDCDQIYVMNLDGTGLKQISRGEGRTTCAYFFPDGKSVLYSSTHLAGKACPPRPSFDRGYVWAVYPGYDIFRSDLEGNVIARLTGASGYDAEATLAPDGSRIVFTSDRDGDLELYSMAPDGSDVRRLTRTPGYDGGAFFSPDSRHICYRAHHPEGGDLEDYRKLLAGHLIRPGILDLMIMDSDGGGQAVVLSNGKANFAPYFHPAGDRIIFSSNMSDPKGRNFDLYLIGTDGSGLERVTWNETFDGFPMFSPDGRQLVFASNREARTRGETNIFLADWVEDPR